MGTVKTIDKHNWWKLWSTYRSTAVTISPFWAVIIIRHHTLLTKYYPIHYLEKLEAKIESYLGKELNFKAQVDLLLCDCLLFSNSSKSESVFSEILELWKESISSTSIYDNLPRTTEKDILSRVGNLIPLLISGRSLSQADSNVYSSFLSKYFLMRQIVDDISDYEKDIMNTTKTFVTENGIEFAKSRVSDYYKDLSGYPIPIFYKNIYQFYINFLDIRT